MSHAQQRQSTVIQKKERKKKKKDQKKPFLGKLLSKKSIKVFDIKCACSAGIIVVLLQITFFSVTGTFIIHFCRHTFQMRVHLISVHMIFVCLFAHPC